MATPNYGLTNTHALADPNNPPAIVNQLADEVDAAIAAARATVTVRAMTVSLPTTGTTSGTFAVDISSFGFITRPYCAVTPRQNPSTGQEVLAFLEKNPGSATSLTLAWVERNNEVINQTMSVDLVMVGPTA